MYIFCIWCGLEREMGTYIGIFCVDGENWYNYKRSFNMWDMVDLRIKLSRYILSRLQARTSFLYFAEIPSPATVRSTSNMTNKCRVYTEISIHFFRFARSFSFHSSTWYFQRLQFLLEEVIGLSEDGDVCIIAMSGERSRVCSVCIRCKHIFIWIWISGQVI